MGEDGQQYLDLIFYARAMAWRNALDGYESEALRTVLATLDAGRAEILREFAARYSTVTDWSAERMQAVIEEMEAMTAGLRKDMTAQYADLTVAAAGPSIAEASAALSVGGLVNVNTVGISSSQLRSFFLETPLGGNTIQNWVDRSFGATVQAEMRQALNVGVLKGEGYRPLVKRIEQGFGMARNEATTLTRTFVSSANAESRRMVYEANRDIVTGWKWLTAGDNFVCILCLPLHGQKFKLGEGPTMPRHPRCLTPETPVFAPDKVAAFVSTYDGPVFEIGLSDGRGFTVTPNHMFLTPNGFSPAKSFRKGDYVFSSSGANRPPFLVGPDNNGNPSRIDNVVEAFAKTSGMGSLLVPAAPEHLHGDGEFVKGDIHVIAPHSLLKGDMESFVNEHGHQFPFPFAGDLSPFEFERLRLQYLPLLWLRDATDGGMSGKSVFEVFLDGSGRHHKPVGFSGVAHPHAARDEALAYWPSADAKRVSDGLLGLSRLIAEHDVRNRYGDVSTHGACRLSANWLNAMPFEYRGDCVNANSVLLRDLARRFPKSVSIANVEFVRERHFRGHVYDLQTLTSLYYVNGVLSSNCRCTSVPATVTWRELGIPMDELRAEADRWVLRGKVGQDGEISVKPIGTGGANEVLRVGRFKDADAWWASLSPAEKRATSVGPGRAKLLDEGKISMRDLVGADFKPKTLEELRGMSR